MITNGDSKGQEAYNNGENPFTIASDNAEDGGELVIEIDNEEVINTAVKSVIGGIATGLVVNRFLQK